MENTIIEPKFNGIDVVGDSPILRRNQVLRPRALALHVEDFQPPSGHEGASRSRSSTTTRSARRTRAVAAGTPAHRADRGDARDEERRRDAADAGAGVERPAHASAG